MKERVLQGHLNRSNNITAFISAAGKKKADLAFPPQMRIGPQAHADVGSRSWRCNAITPFIETT
jgi:hypothetical protein